MKSKKNIISVLLAAVILCACILGVLITGVGAEETVTIYYVDSETGDNATPATADDGNLVFKTVEGALNYAGEQDWEASTVLSIKVRDELIEYSKSGKGNVFLKANAGRIFRQDKTGLPITVGPDEGIETLTIEAACILASDKVTYSVGNLYVVNDFTFENTNFTTDKGGEVNFFVSGTRVDFANCTFDSNTTFRMQPNGYTSSSYGINGENYQTRMTGDKVISEIVISGNTVMGANVFVYGIGEIAGSSHFAADVQVKNGDDVVTTIPKQNFNGKVTVQDNANVTNLYGTRSAGLGTSTVTVKGSAQVTSFLGSTTEVSAVPATTNVTLNVEENAVVNTMRAYVPGSENLTINGGAKVVMNIAGGHVKRLEGLYSGSGKSITMKSGASVEINVTGTAEGVTHSSTKEYIALVSSEYPNITAQSGTTLSLNLKNVDSGTVCGARASSGKVVKIQGDMNITVDGGSCASLYGFYDTKTANVGYIECSGNTTVSVKGGATVKGNLYGAIHAIKTTEDSLLTIDLDGAILKKAIYGIYSSYDASIGTYLDGETEKTAAVSSYAGKVVMNLKNTTTSSNIFGVKFDKANTVNTFVSGASLEMNVGKGTEYTAWIYLVDGIKNGNITATLDTTFNMNGGNAGSLRPFQYATLDGDASFRFDTTEADSSEIKFSGTIQLGWTASVTGKIDFSAKGCEEYPVTFDSLYGGTPAGGMTFDLDTVSTKGNVGLARDNKFEGDLIGNLVNVKIGGSYVGGGTSMAIGEGGTTGSVTNILTDVEIAKFYCGGAAGNTVIPASVTNTLKNVTIGEYFVGGSENGTENDVVTSTFENVSVAGFAVAGNLNNAAKETLTIKSGSFGGRVSGAKVALVDNAAITLANEGAIEATEVGTGVTITKEGAWGAFNTVYVSAPANADITIKLGEGAGETYYLNKEGYEVRGWYLAPEVSLVLNERVELKVLFNKSLADLYLAKVGNPSFAFKLDGKDQGVGFADLTEDGANYVLTLPAAGAGDFDLLLEYAFNGNAAVSTTIQELAEKGVTLYAGTADEAIFKALVDYGSAANGATELLYFDATKLEAATLPEAAAPVAGAGNVKISAVTLLMGDAIGIRFKSESDLTGITVKVNGELLGPDYVSTKESAIDLYINAENLNEIINIEIYDANGTLCATFGYAVSNIAAEIYKNDATNLKAAAVLELILAVEAAKTVA